MMRPRSGASRRHPAAHGLALVALLASVPALAQDSGSLDALAPLFRPQQSAAVPTQTPTPEAGGQSAVAVAPRPHSDTDGLRVLVLRGSQSMATIDGRQVHVGDRVHGLRVARIDPGGVLLVGEGANRRELSIAPLVKKRPATPPPENNGVRP